MNNSRKQINKLKKNIAKLQRQLECSEWKRRHLEDIRERGQLFLRTINNEIEQARKLIAKQNRELKLLNRDLENEKKKSDILLLNILPAEIAEALKQKGKVIPVLYESVSVLFSDFSGFTKVAEKMTPSTLIKELDICFSAFDKICEKYGLEKLKTIGDSYMCAGGVPVPNTTHALDTVLAGLEMLRFRKRRITARRRKKHPFWETRIGIHSGPLIAGIIGKKKFAYDIWGDTVNVASRMESSGIINEVNISQSTYESVSGFFRTKHRGKVELKNRGKLDMYVVTGLKRHYLTKTHIPNKKFSVQYNLLK